MTGTRQRSVSSSSSAPPRSRASSDATLFAVISTCASFSGDFRFDLSSCSLASTLTALTRTPSADANALRSFIAGSVTCSSLSFSKRASRSLLCDVLSLFRAASDASAGYSGSSSRSAGASFALSRMRFTSSVWRARRTGRARTRERTRGAARRGKREREGARADLGVFEALQRPGAHRRVPAAIGLLLRGLRVDGSGGRGGGGGHDARGGRVDWRAGG